MPHGVQNPVKFYSGGDTTSQAIKKHIDEFLHVYSILNDLGTGKATVVTSQNTVLKKGEIGITFSPWALRVGDGVSKWSQLKGASVVEIIDDLLSEAPDKALSAKQGKALKELIDAIHIPEIVDDLTTGGSDKTLSAEQGKALKGIIDTLTTPVPGPPGPKGLEWRGAWDGDTEYRKDDAVSYKGTSYIAVKGSTGELPTAAEFWDVLSAKGADGTGTGDMLKADYDSDGDGKVDAAAVADTANTAAVANSANAVAWNNVTGKPASFGPEVVDALDSDKADAALSAKQGKTLNTLIREVKVGVPETFLGIIKDATQAVFFTVPGTAQDVWFVRVYLANIIVSLDDVYPISFFRDPDAGVNGHVVGAGALMTGGTKLDAQTLGQCQLISDYTLGGIKALIFMGEKVNLS